MAKSQTEVSETMKKLTYTDKDGNELTISPNPEWKGYGDADPELHGGLFIRAERDMWQVIETIPGYDVPDFKAKDDENIIQVYWVEPQDLFVDGNPDKGPTDAFKKEIDSLGNVSGYVNALVDFYIEYFIAGIARSYLHGDERDEKVVSNYWEELEGYDITKDDI